MKKVTSRRLVEHDDSEEDVSLIPQPDSPSVALPASAGRRHLDQDLNQQSPPLRDTIPGDDGLSEKVLAIRRRPQASAEIGRHAPPCDVIQGDSDRSSCCDENAGFRSSRRFSSSMASGRRPPAVTVLMPYKHPSESGVEKRTTVVKFKPFTSKEKETWLGSNSNHGFVRVYEPNSKEILQRNSNQKQQQTPSVVVPCSIDTTCRQICEKLAIVDNELHVTLNGDTVRRLDPNDRPLRIQNGYLSAIGIDDLRRQQETGDSIDLCFLVKFSAGRPVINDEFGRSSLSCYCHVRKGRVFHHWTKRLCVLNSSRLLVYPDLDRSGTPDVIALSRAKVEDIHLRSRGRCIKITVAAPRRPVQTFYIAFDSAVDLSTWLSRCLKGSAKVPPISDLSNLQLEYLPEQVFCIGSERLLTQLNLRRNCLKHKPINEDSFTVGWLDDLPRLESLRSLNLADNDLRSCPTALFELNALTELVLSGNKLSELPAGIGKLRNLQTLSVQNNWLSRLPTELAECESLSNLDLSFNRFAKIPDLLGKLNSVDQWILNGNEIEKFVDEALFKSAPCIKKIELRRCKLVQNAITTIQVGLLPLLTHLDIRDNRCLTSLDLKSLPSLQVLSCQRGSLYDLQLNGSALTCLFASKNNLRNLVVMPVPKQLKVFDVSHNNLNKLPEWLTELCKIEKIIASHNRLINLPHRMFTSVSSIKTLILNHNNIANLPSQVENCFIEFLDLHHNKLTQLPGEFLASAHKLRILNLSENLLVDLPPLNPFLDLNKVQQLYLACNRLTDEAISVISGYRRLRVLDLAYNAIKNVDDSCVEKLQLLESVNLSGNRLQCLPPFLASAPNLVVLRAHSNRLISLPDFSSAPSLKVLDCGSNQLEMVDVRHLLSPQLKHLDVSCNPRLRLDTSAFQQFRSERLVSLIDMSRESRATTTPTTNTQTTDLPTNNNVGDKPPWQAGFSETSGERNKLCVSQIRCPMFRKEKNLNGALFAIIDGGLNNELPQHLASKFPDILWKERLDEKTKNEYMKYTLLKAHQGLKTSGQKMGASCTLCHIEENDNGEPISKDENGKKRAYTLRLANSGHTEAVLCRKGKALTLTKRFLIEDGSPEEIERIRKAGAILTEENEVNGITPCSRLLGCNFLYPAVVPCPHSTNVELQSNDEFLLIASRGLWDVMDQTEAVRRIRRISNPILAAKHLQDVAQSYGFKENLSILVVRFFFTPSTRESEVVAQRTSPAVPPPVTTANRRLGAVMSAVDVADSDDEYSLTSDEDVKSEPRDTKLVREPPNYYFEYKKQLKQLMLDAGSSDDFSIDGPESLYSVATLVCDERQQRIEDDENRVGASIDRRRRDHRQDEDNFRRYFDDGYQSSEIGTPKPIRLSFPEFNDNGGYASLVSNNQHPSFAHRLLGSQSENGREAIGIDNPDRRTEEKHSTTSSPRSASSSCSSGLGKSSAASPDHPLRCGHRRIDEEEIGNGRDVPRWRIDDQEALQDVKQRFQMARELILAKLGPTHTQNEQAPQPPPPPHPQLHVAKIAILGDSNDEFKKSSKSNLRDFDLSRRNSCPLCSSKGDGIDVGVSTDFCVPIYETPTGSQRQKRFSKRQAIYEKLLSRDDAELFDDLSPRFRDESWPDYPSAAHSDDQIQCCSSWHEVEIDRQRPPVPPFKPSQPPKTYTKSISIGHGARRHPTLIVANIDIDGTGPQNVVICDPESDTMHQTM